MNEVAGDFFTCCGDVREPDGGEKAVWVCEAEKGVDTGGVGAAPGICEGVRPCCEGPWRIGVDMMTGSLMGLANDIVPPYQGWDGESTKNRHESTKPRTEMEALGR